MSPAGNLDRAMSAGRFKNPDGTPNMVRTLQRPGTGSILRCKLKAQPTGWACQCVNCLSVLQMKAAHEQTAARVREPRRPRR